MSILCMLYHDYPPHSKAADLKMFQKGNMHMAELQKEKMSQVKQKGKSREQEEIAWSFGFFGA